MKKNLLMITIDKEILNISSDVFSRVENYARYFKRLTVIVFSKKPSRPLRKDNLVIYSTNSLSKLFYYFDALKLLERHKILKELDLISVQDPYDTGLLALFIKKLKPGIVLNIQCHADIFNNFWKYDSWLNFIRYQVATVVLRRADSIRVVSQRIRDKLIGKLRISQNKIRNIPVPVNINLAKQGSFGAGRKNIRFLIISRFVKEKNIPLALRAVAQVVKKYPQISLTIVGKGPEYGKIKYLIGKYKLAKNLELKGWTDNVYAEYARADALILTSHCEGWARSCIEALMSGRPVIMTDVGCAGEAVLDKYNGLISRVNDLPGLAANIELFLRDAKLRKKLTANARTIYKTKYVDSKLLLNEFIQSLLDSRVEKK